MFNLIGDSTHLAITKRLLSLLTPEIIHGVIQEIIQRELHRFQVALNNLG